MADLNSSGRSAEKPTSASKPVAGPSQDFKAFPDSVALGIFFGLILDVLALMVLYAGGMKALFYIYYFGVFQFVVLIPCILWCLYAGSGRLLRGFFIAAGVVIVINVGGCALINGTLR